MQHRIKLKYVAVVVCATVAMACSEGVQSPASPSAVGQSSAALNADGSNLKVTAPIAVSPLFEATNVAQAPTLAAIGSQGINVSNPGLSYRFQVADSDSFENIVANGMGAATFEVRTGSHCSRCPARRSCPLQEPGRQVTA